METGNNFFSADIKISMVCPSATEEKGVSMFRGWRGGEYVLVDIPRFKHAFPMNKYEKAEWVVRYIYQGKVIGFVIRGRLCVTACDLYVLSYPKKVETHSLRKQLRAELNIPLVLHTSSNPDAGEVYKGMSTDISAGGLGIKLHEDIKKFDSYYISIFLPTGRNIKYAECRIIKSNFGKRGHEFGVEFINLREDYKIAVDKCLQQFYEDLDEGKNILPGESR